MTTEKDVSAQVAQPVKNEEPVKNEDAGAKVTNGALKIADIISKPSELPSDDAAAIPPSATKVANGSEAAKQPTGNAELAKADNVSAPQPEGTVVPKVDEPASGADAKTDAGANPVEQVQRADEKLDETAKVSTDVSKEAKNEAAGEAATEATANQAEGSNVDSEGVAPAKSDAIVSSGDSAAKAATDAAGQGNATEPNKTDSASAVAMAQTTDKPANAEKSASDPAIASATPSDDAKPSKSEMDIKEKEPSSSVAKPADAKPLAEAAEKATAEAAGKSEDAKMPAPGSGGVRFGRVEVVPPPAVPEAKEADNADNADDANDEDYKMEEDTEEDAKDGDGDGDMVGGGADEPMDEALLSSAAKDVQLPKGLLAKLLSDGSTPKEPLHEAAAEGNLEEVKSLLRDKENKVEAVNEVDVFAYTPLHFAAENGHLEVCKALVELKADVNASTKLHSSTVLHYAAFNGHEEVLKFLLESGAKVNALTDDNRTPLFQAAFRGHTACVKTLLEHGADASIKNSENKSPEDVAASEEVRAAVKGEPAPKRQKLETGKQS